MRMCVAVMMIARMVLHQLRERGDGDISGGFEIILRGLQQALLRHHIERGEGEGFGAVDHRLIAAFARGPCREFRVVDDHARRCYRQHRMDRRHAMADIPHVS